MQNGNPIRHWTEVGLWLSEEININTDESGLVLEWILRNNGNPPRFSANESVTGTIGLRVVSPSENVPGRFSFPEIYAPGLAVPGLDFDVVVTGESVASNSHRFLPPEPDKFQERASFSEIGYSVTVHRIIGMEIIDYTPSPPPTPRPPLLRRTYTAESTVNIDGHSIRAIAFHEAAPNVVSAMINPRVFAEIIGAEVDWDARTRAVTITGIDPKGTRIVTQFDMNWRLVNVNRIPFDIAIRAGQPELEGKITPVIIDGRMYVPARVLAEIFDVHIEFENGKIIIG
jgi:hypothetical protein